MNKVITICIIVLAVIGLGAFITSKEEPPLFEKDFNDLSMTIDYIDLTEDEDDGKIIVNVPVYLNNTSDHAFKFKSKEIKIDGEVANGGLFSDLNSIVDSDVSGKISRNKDKDGTVTLKLDTRNIDDVKKVEYSFEVYDMKMEKKKEYIIEETF